MILLLQTAGQDITSLKTRIKTILEDTRHCVEGTFPKVVMEFGKDRSCVLLASPGDLDDLERCEDTIPPCPYEPETLPCPKPIEDCKAKQTEDIWSDIDDHWYHEKFPWKIEGNNKCFQLYPPRSDDPSANGKL